MAHHRRRHPQGDARPPARVHLLSRLLEAADLAKQLGAQVMGLGAFTMSSATPASP